MRVIFQFPPLREGRRGRWEADCCGRYFNSRPSARGDSFAPKDGDTSMAISIPAPPRGATVFEPDGVTVYKFQFTPLREGRHEAPEKQEAAT